MRSLRLEIPEDPPTGPLLVDFNLRFDVLCRIGLVVVAPMRDIVEVGVFDVGLATAADRCATRIVPFVPSADIPAVQGRSTVGHGG